MRAYLHCSCKIFMIYYSIVKRAWLQLQRPIHVTSFIPRNAHSRAHPCWRGCACLREASRLLPFPGGEDGGSWTRGVFQRREPCLLPHLPGAALARRGRRFWLPVQDADFEYPFVVSACHWIVGIHNCKRPGLRVCQRYFHYGEVSPLGVRFRVSRMPSQVVRIWISDWLLHFSLVLFSS